jgi:NADH-quinone oxidoreductase subunit A
VESLFAQIIQTITQLGPQFWSATIYVLATFAICAIMLIGSALLGGKSTARARNEPFESGVVAASPEKLRLSAKFYLVAMFFVIFDVEALYLYAWAVSAREAGWAGWIEATVFVTILTASLVYLAKIGALDWTPHQKKRRAAQIKSQG